MLVSELRNYLKGEWPRIKEALLVGRYKPQAVREVEIPKVNGGKRMLGIPMVVDRLYPTRPAPSPESDIRRRIF